MGLWWRSEKMATIFQATFPNAFLSPGLSKGKKGDYGMLSIRLFVRSFVHSSIPPPIRSSYLILSSPNFADAGKQQPLDRFTPNQVRGGGGGGGGGGGCYANSRHKVRYVCFQGGGYLAIFLHFVYFPYFSASPTYMLVTEYHVHIWLVLPWLRSGTTCQIWMWCKESNRYFCRLKCCLGRN